MANYNCSACEDLRQSDPNLVVNGFTEDECASLAAGNGLNGGYTCDDLHDMNDCFVGMMENEVNAYEACDWKKFMRKFIPNVWATLKGIICALCGFDARISRNDCLINHLIDGDNLEIGEDSSSDSYIVPGGGVSFKYDSDGGDDRISDFRLLYIAGGLLRAQGTFRFFTADFKDEDNRDRNGNSHWNDRGAMTAGGELICEIRVKKSQFGVKNIYAGFGQETGGGGYHLNATVFSDKDSDGNPVYAYGQHGNCNTKTGEPASGSGHSTGHKVASGYIYIQLRMSYIWALNAYSADDLDSNKKPKSSVVKRYSPRAFMGIRFDKNSIEC